MSFAGGVAWNALMGEYVLHRFGLHLPRSPLRWHPAHREHLRHHATAFFAPLWIKLALVAPLLFLGVFLGLRSLIALVINVVDPLWFAVGAALYYVAFEVGHHRMHVAPPSTALGLWLRRYHLAHHFDKGSNFGFFGGIVFDVLFGTCRAGGVGVPVLVDRRLSVPWLHDGTRVFAPYGEYFELAPPSTSS